MMLAACGGGGGVNSTPPPAPAPTPTPSPAPSPTPSPAPGANTDLVAPLASESFANNAVTATVNYSSAGSKSGQSQSAQPLTIHYDASADSYTLSVAGRSQTFRAADKVSGALPTWRRTSGSVTDDLTLTPNGLAAPFSRYRYVGGGMWQRQTQTGSGGINGSIDAFSYGIPTADLVRSGKGFYPIELLGATSAQVPPAAFYGNGMMTADFDTGKIIAEADIRTGTYNGPASSSNRDGDFAAQAQLSASANSFTGTFTSASFNTYTGTINGRFYGPAGDEVGASFSGAAANGDIMAGFLLGKKDETLVVPTLAEIKDVTIFHDIGSRNERVRYDPVAQTYTLMNMIEAIGDITVGPGQKAVSADNRFIEYKVEQDGVTRTLQFYKSGSADTEILLSYATFVRARAEPSPASPFNFAYQDSVFGVKTPLALVPKTGTAEYSGIIFGEGWTVEGGVVGPVSYTASGTSHFKINFAQFQATGSLNIVLTSRADGTVVTWDPQLFTGMFTGNELSGVINGDGFTDIRGALFGPDHSEIGAAFYTRDQADYRHMSVSGITVGKKD